MTKAGYLINKGYTVKDSLDRQSFYWERNF